MNQKEDRGGRGTLAWFWVFHSSGGLEFGLKTIGANWSLKSLSVLMTLFLFIIQRNVTGKKKILIHFKFLLWACEMVNILLIFYCWTIVHDMALDCSYPLSKIAVQICSIVTLGCSTLVDLSRSTGAFSAGSQWSKWYEWMKHTLEFTFHCILMVLELNLVIHWSNICFVDLFNTERNVLF